MKYFLSISGHVSLNKCREFEQTTRFVFNQLSPGCLDHHLAKDVHVADLYHIFLIWNSADSLIAFKSSKEFLLLKGACKTLNVFEKEYCGKWMDVQLFDIRDN